jgi:antirestriction protein ArdC
MPELRAFESAEAYYGTLFHELVHSTGHESRLGRLEPALFGTDSYAREELVAEMGAAMLCGLAGLEPQHEASASYIASWLRRLRDDRKLVIQAAAQAQKASDRIIGKTFETVEPIQEEETIYVAA